MKELYVEKDGVIKKIHENIASEYKLIGWKIISEEEANKVNKIESKPIILTKKEVKED
jgi:hypothetical protein